MHKAFIAMEKKADLQHNKTVHLENSMVMYGIYNSETFEKLIKTVHKCTILLPGLKSYLPENLLSGITDIYIKMVLAIMP